MFGLLFGEMGIDLTNVIKSWLVAIPLKCKASNSDVPSHSIVLPCEMNGTPKTTLLGFSGLGCDELELSLLDGAVELSLDPWLSLLDGAVELSLDPWLSLLDGAVELSLDPWLSLLDGAVELSLDPWLSLLDGAVELSLDPWLSLLDGTVELSLDPWLSLLDGAVELLLFESFEEFSVLPATALSPWSDFAISSFDTFSPAGLFELTLLSEPTIV